MQPLSSQLHAALVFVQELVLAPPLLLPLPVLSVMAPSPLSLDDPLLELDSTPPSPTVPPDDDLELEQAIARSAAGRTTSARLISEGCLPFIGSRNPAPLGSFAVRYDGRS